MLFLLFAPPFYGQKKNVLLKIFFSNVEFYIKPSRRVSVSMHTGQEWLKKQRLSIKLLRHSNFLFSFFLGWWVLLLLPSCFLYVWLLSPHHFFFFSLPKSTFLSIAWESLLLPLFSQSKQKNTNSPYLLISKYHDWVTDWQ